MSNFGIYIESVANHAISRPAMCAANTALVMPEIDDVSLFYQEIGKKPEKTNFGMFNSTDVWFFEGNLVVTFLDGLNFATKAVNNKKIYYYFGLEDNVNLFSLLSATSNSNVWLIANNEDSAEYLRTKINKEPICICPDLSDVPLYMNGVSV